ncbi:MAG: tetratricopeptide repeat protein [Phycisphaerales bacterium]|nr:tetratricopeptide repeat protein [Phycisphaerales bacterium]
MRLRMLMAGLTTAVLSAWAVAQPAAPAVRDAMLETRSTPDLVADATALLAEFKSTRSESLLADARRVLGVLLTRDPLNTDANLLSGELGLEANDYDTARKYFAQVTQIEPNNYRANVGLGRIWNANRSFRQAVLFLELAERVAPDVKRGSEVKRLLASSYLGMGNVTKALEKIEEAIRLDPESLESLRARMDINLQLAARDPAFIPVAVSDSSDYLARVRKQAEAEPGSVERLREVEQAYDAAILAVRTLHNSYYERDAQRRPTNRLIRDKEAEAAAALNRLAELAGEVAVIRLTIANHDIIQFAAAKAVELDPKNVKYLENLAALYQRTNQREQAIETCQKILALQPSHAAARQFLDSVGVPVTTEPAAEPPSPAPGD